jgi:hypothetical protein
LGKVSKPPKKSASNLRKKMRPLFSLKYQFVGGFWPEHFATQSESFPANLENVN